MKNNKKTPEIRFKGFTDDWEQRKLGEVATYRRGSFPQPYGKSEWYDGNGAMPFVQVADVSDEMNLVGNTKQKISILAQPMSVFAEQNSVVVTLQGSIGRVAIMQYEAFVDRTVLIFEKYKVEIDKTFWAYIIKQKFIDEARKAPGGTIKTITKEALSNFDLSIPKYQEQKQIGAYFCNLDNLITLHQRKYEKLKNIKQSLLEKMFPKNGMKIPEIRFKGFTDDWEQRKFDEITKITMGQSPKSNNYTNNPNDCLLIQGNADLDSGRVVPRIWTTEITKKSYPNDIIFTVRAPVGEVARSSYFSTIGRGVCAFKGNEFLYQELVRKNEIKFWEKLSSGSTFDSINSEQLKNIYINMPKEILEQDKIGKILGKLDNIITLHQRKYEKLKNIKQALLDKMFV